MRGRSWPGRGGGVNRHPSGAAVRAGCERVCHRGLRAQDVLYAPPPLRPCVGRVHRHARRDRDGARDADGLAAPPGPTPEGHPADPGRALLGRTARVGRQGDAAGRRTAGEPWRLEDPAGPPGRAVDRPGGPRTARPVEGETTKSVVIGPCPEYRPLVRVRPCSGPSLRPPRQPPPPMEWPGFWSITGAARSGSPGPTTPCTSDGWCSTTSLTPQRPGRATSSRPSPRPSATCSPNVG